MMPSTIRVALWRFLTLSLAVVAVHPRKLEAQTNDVAGMLLNILSEEESHLQCHTDTEEFFATHNIKGFINHFHNTLVVDVNTDNEGKVIITNTFSENDKRSVDIVCVEAIGSEGLLVEANYPLSCTSFDEEQGKEVVTFVHNYADCFAKTPACEKVDYIEYLASRGVSCTEIGKNEEPGIDQVGCLDGEVQPDGSFDLKFCNCDSDCTIDWLNADTTSPTVTPSNGPSESPNLPKQVCECAAAQAADCCNGQLGPLWWNNSGSSSKQGSLSILGMMVGAAAIAVGI